MSAAVASRYARALADLAMRPGAGIEPQQVLEQLELVVSTLAVSSELRAVLLSPAVAAPEKRGIVSRLSSRLGISSLVTRFLYVLIDRRRTEILGEIRQAFEAVLDERLGLVRVDVVSARELGKSEREALASSVANLTGKKARPRYFIDPELIGGVIARVGSTIYDGSVRGQLESLERQLAGAGQ